MFRDGHDTEGASAAAPRAASAENSAPGGSLRQLRAPARRGLGPPWLRGVAVLVAQVVGTTVLAGVGAVAYEAACGAERPLPLLLPLAAAYLPLLALIALTWWGIDREPLSSLGYVWNLRRIAAGLGLGTLAGIALLCVPALVGALAGDYEFSRRAVPWGELLLTVPVLFVAAHYEEALTRGYLLQAWGRRRPVVGLVVTSLLFALLHAANPGFWEHGAAGGLLALMGVGLAGLLLGLLFLRAGDLWLPTGVHFGWNLAQGWILGLPVSGMSIPGLLEGRLARPDSLVAGGHFGIEAAPFTVALLATATWLAARGLRSLRVPAAGASAVASATAVPPTDPGA